jgi:hypothetical protein
MQALLQKRGKTLGISCFLDTCLPGGLEASTRTWKSFVKASEEIPYIAIFDETIFFYNNLEHYAKI